MVLGMNKLLCVIALCFLNFFAVADSQKIGDYINDILKSTFVILNNNDLNVDKKENQLEEILRQNLDFEYMSKQVLGRASGGVSSSDFSAFKAVYAKYIVSIYAGAVKNYRGQHVEIKSVTQNNLGMYVVQTVIRSSDNAATFNINYQVAKAVDGGFKIQDIITEGISLISTQRADFGSVISGGSSILPLIQKLSVMVN